MELQVTGAEGYLRLSKALKHAGATQLRKEMNKTLQATAKPLIAKTRAAALADLPHAGGLARQVARAPQRVQTRTGRDPGVRIVVSRRAGARASNRGTIRHPVFADKSLPREEWTWREQQVKAGWFDETIGAFRVEFVAALEKAMQDVLDEVVRRAR